MPDERSLFRAFVMTGKVEYRIQSALSCMQGKAVLLYLCLCRLRRKASKDCPIMECCTQNRAVI